MKIIDLSQNIEMGQPVYPGLAKTLVNTWNTFEETARVQGGGRMKRLYTTCSIFMSDHASTHIDAIVHFGQREGTADQIPLEYCYAEGIALDFSYKKPKEYITFSDIEKELKRKRLQIKRKDVVLMHTGASKHWGTAKYFEHIVPIEADAVQKLYRRGVRVIGVDEITIDIDPSYPAHSLAKTLDWYHIENMTNIDRIPRPRFKFIGLPLKLVAASAAPMRAVAVVED